MQGSTDWQAVDARLLSAEQLEHAEVSDSSIDALASGIRMDNDDNPDDAENIEDSAATYLPAADMTYELSQLYGSSDEPNGLLARDVSGDDFVMAYARDHVVCHTKFALEWPRYIQHISNGDNDDPFMDSIGKHTLRGHSRDDPTPSIQRCHTKGCSFGSLIVANTAAHKKSGVCNLDKVREIHRARALFDEASASASNDSSFRHCDYPDCLYVALADDETKVKRMLQSHVQRIHNWIPKPCEHGCTDHIYQSQGAYSSHIQTVHGSRWPIRCPYPGCNSEKEFSTLNTLNYHLRVEHRVAPSDRAQYYPLITTKAFKPQGCVVNDCEPKDRYGQPKIFEKLKDLTRHCSRAHKDLWSDAAAEADLLEKAVRDRLTRRHVCMLILQERPNNLLAALPNLWVD